jgi:transcriptional regulator
MYIPAHFDEKRDDVLYQLIVDHPLATIVTFGRDGLAANHIPFLLERAAEGHGALIGHVARNNPLWHDHDVDVDALVIFEGPSAYISPNWYTTKQETHEVVPTYNYTVVHAYGRIIVHDDARWVRGAIGKLTKAMEASQPVPWRMADAPSDFLRRQIEQIVGIEIPIARLSGKWKTSQNRVASDRAGVVGGLRKSGNASQMEMADLVQDTLFTRE